MKRSIILALGLALLMSITAYAADKVKEVKVRRVEITLEKATVRVNQVRTLDAHVMPTNADDKSFYWESMNPEVAVVDEEGNVIGVSPGTAEIRAVSGTGKYGSCIVTVPDTIIRGAATYIKNEDMPGAWSTSGETLRAAAVKVDVEKAVKGASKGETAAVTYRDKKTVSTAALRAAAYTAEFEKGAAELRFVTQQGETTQGALYLNPQLAPQEDRELKVGVYTDLERTADMRETAQAQFGRAVVVKLEQQGAFGMPVQVRAKVDLSALEGRALTLYYYENESYIPLAQQEHSLDGAGFLHFTADRGGYIVIA